MTNEAFTNTSIAFIRTAPNALKHTRRDGTHRIFESNLIAQEVAALFREKISLQVGDKLPAEFVTGKLDQSLRVHLNSQTSTHRFREIIADIYPSGTCTVFHYLEHHDSEQFTKREVEMQNMPYFFVVNLDVK